MSSNVNGKNERKVLQQISGSEAPRQFVSIDATLRMDEKKILFYDLLANNIISSSLPGSISSLPMLCCSLSELDTQVDGWFLKCI